MDALKAELRKHEPHVYMSYAVVAACNCYTCMHANSQSKKRGLSLEEKRDKVLEIFHETKDVFQLKVQCYSSYERPAVAHK